MVFTVFPRVPVAAPAVTGQPFKKTTTARQRKIPSQELMTEFRTTARWDLERVIDAGALACIPPTVLNDVPLRKALDGDSNVYRAAPRCH